MIDNYIAEISAIDGNSYILVMMMCAFGCFLINIVVQSAVYSVCSYPVLLYCSLAANNFLPKLNFFVSAEKYAIVAFSTGVGMTVGVCALIALFFVAGGLYRPSGPKRHDLPRSSRAAME